MPFRQTLVMALLVSATGCTRAGVPTPEPPEGVTGPAAVTTSNLLSGMVTLGGRRLRVLLELTTDDRGGGTGRLTIPDLPLDANGSAAWRDDALLLDLRYDGDCPGDLRIRAKRTPDGTRVEGTLTAKDCTGEESGTVVLEVATRPSESAADRLRVESSAGGV
jgi:hypothetical protein